MGLYNDDEPVVPNKQAPGSTGPSFPVTGKAKETIDNSDAAPLQQCDFYVMVTLTGELGSRGSGSRLGVDIVTVLDVSGSMDGDKIDDLKIAMRFLINKLSPVDRLSIVTFSDDADRLCKLTAVTPEAVPKLEGLAKGLAAGGSTNIAAGLEIALKVIAGRQNSEARRAAVMLMTDGEQNRGDALAVAAGGVPVFTFGFGKDFDSTILQKIAEKSGNGTFNVADTGKLTGAFSQALGLLLSVSVDDLTATFKVPAAAKDVKIKSVAAGDYPQKVAGGGAVTVELGNLYHKETRKIIVTLALPAVANPATIRVLQIQHSYTTIDPATNKPTPPKNSTPRFVGVRRTAGAVPAGPKRIQLEMKRLETTTMMKEARVLADGDKFTDATRKLSAAQLKLEAAKFDEPELTATIELLKYEVEQLKSFMATPETYRAEGRAFALSSELSHARQRFAARGDVEKLRLFATPRMNEYLKQAIAFADDPTRPPPSSDEELKEEVAAELPAAPASPGAVITLFLQQAVQAMIAIQERFCGRS